MIIQAISKVLAAALGRRGSAPGYVAVAIGEVARRLAERASNSAVRGVEEVRKLSLVEVKAKIVENEAKIARALKAVDADNAKKRAAAQKFGSDMMKNLKTTNDPMERAVLRAEMKAHFAARIAEANEIYDAALARVRAKGGDIIIDPSNLSELIREGNAAEKLLIAGAA